MATSMDRKQKKRKIEKSKVADDISDGASITKKSKQNTSFSEVEFKFLLSDHGTAMQGLENFISSAEEFTKGESTSDVVAGYCRSSEACMELFGLIDPAALRLKPNEVALVLNCLCLILNRIRTDLHKFSSTGEAVVQRILSVHMGQIYNCLSDQNKSNTIKAPLQLLAAMVLLSDRAKKAVATRLNFSHIAFIDTFKRRNRKDPEDVRTCSVRLTLALLSDSDLDIVTSLVQHKDFLLMTMDGLKYDRADLVVEVLSTFLDKVVTSPGITKTDKMKLFAAANLRHLLELYNWQGLGGWAPKKKNKRKEKKSQAENVEGFTKEKSTVAAAVHDFLVELCCSHRHGINFYDKTFGTGSRNHNMLLAQLVYRLTQQIDNPLVADLILEILIACPDLIKSKLSKLSPSLAPRWSDKWRNLVDWVTKLYKKLPDVPSFMAGPDYLKEDNSAIIAKAAVFCLPPPNVAGVLQSALKHEDIRVRDKYACLILELLKKACVVHSKMSKDLASAAQGDATFDDSLLAAFSSRVIKVLPPVNQVFECIYKYMQVMAGKQPLATVAQSSVPLTKESTVDVTSHASVLLQVLGLFQTLVPSLLLDRPKDMAKLVEMVGSFQSLHQGQTSEQDIEGGNTVSTDSIDENSWLPQLYLLKLLSDTDARKISLGREGLMEKLLQSACLNPKLTSLTIGLIIKMLQSVEVLAGHIRELHIWLEIAMSSSSAQAEKQPIRFLARCLTAIINNPTPYVDRVMDAMEDVTPGKGSEEMNVDSFPSENHDRAFESILAMSEKELDSILGSCQSKMLQQWSNEIHLHFSPLAVVALDILKHSEAAPEDVSSVLYVSRTLVRLIHSLAEPVVLVRFVSKSEVELYEGVGPYIEYWAGNNHECQPLPDLVCGQFTSALMLAHLGDQSQHCVAKLQSLMKKLENREKICGLRLTLLLMEDTMQRNAKVMKMEEKINVFTQVATYLLDQIDESECQTDQGHIMSQFKSAMNSADKMECRAESGAETHVDDTDTFKRLFSNSGLSVLADDIKCLLKDDLLKNMFNKAMHNVPFVSNIKTPKKKEKCEEISENVSVFVCKLVGKLTNFTRLKMEAEIQEVYVSLILDGLTSRKLPAKLEEACGKTLKSLAQRLSPSVLSKAVVSLLQMPLATFGTKERTDQKGESHLKDDSSAKLSVCALVLCELLNCLKSLIEKDARFLSSNQLKELLSSSKVRTGDPPKEAPLVNSCVMKQCIESVQFELTFSVEDFMGQNVSALVPIFHILSLCKHEHLQEFVTFHLNHAPQIVSFCKTDLIPHVCKSPLKMRKDSPKERLFAALVMNVRDCFLQFDVWIRTHAGLAMKRQKWNLIITYLEATDKFHAGGYTETVKIITQKAKSQLPSLDAAGLLESLPCWRLLSLAVKTSDTSFQQLLGKTIMDQVRQNLPCGTQHFQVLETCTPFEQPAAGPSGKLTNQKQTLVFGLLLDHLTHLVSRSTASDVQTEDCLCDFANDQISKMAKSHWKNFIPQWKCFLENVVRHRLTHVKMVKLATSLTEHVLPPVGADPPEPELKATCRTLFGAIVAHPSFKRTMNSDDKLDARVELVRLLHCLGEQDHSCYSRQELSAVLAPAYTASLSLTDQRLLIMMQRRAENAGTKFECPLLWGREALEQQSVSKMLSGSLHAQVTTLQTLKQLNAELIEESILNYPLRRAHLNDPVSEASEFKSKPNCYDPSFLLRLFVQILSPDKKVPFAEFVEKNCLSYLIVALSSHDIHLRLLAYHALNDFYLHVEGSKWQYKVEVAFVLDLLTASRANDAEKLTSVVALFFAKAVKLVLNPADAIYHSVFRFFLAKPEVDLKNVPEFYNFFFHQTNKLQRKWMVSLLCQGMRESSDFWLYQKKFVFKIILSFFDSAVSDTPSQEHILQTVINACKIKYVAVQLVKNHGLMPWLLSAISRLERRPEQADLFCDIVHTLWQSLAVNKYLAKPKKSDDALASSSTETAEAEVPPDESTSTENKIPSATIVEMGLVMKNLLWHLNKCSAEARSKALFVFQGLIGEKPHTDEDNLSAALNATLSGSHDIATSSSHSHFQKYISLTPLEGCLLFYHISTVARQVDLADAVKSLLKSRGFDLDVSSTTTAAPSAETSSLLQDSADAATDEIDSVE